MNFNSAFVKLLRERIVNLQSGNEYLLQIRNCKIKKNKSSNQLYRSNWSCEISDVVSARQSNCVGYNKTKTV